MTLPARASLLGSRGGSEFARQIEAARTATRPADRTIEWEISRAAAGAWYQIDVAM